MNGLTSTSIIVRGQRRLARLALVALVALLASWPAWGQELPAGGASPNPAEVPSFLDAGRSSPTVDRDAGPSQGSPTTDAGLTSAPEDSSLDGGIEEDGGNPVEADAGVSPDGGGEGVTQPRPGIDAGLVSPVDGGGEQLKSEAIPPSPGFTQDRQFTNAALWLLDPGQYTVEQWWSGQWGQPQTLVGTNNQQNQLLQSGVAMGITPHVELDVYANVDLGLDSRSDYEISRTGLTGVAAVLRVAIGRQWGQIWGNPVIEAELWGRVFEPTRVEGRVLLGGELVPGWLLDLNLMFARDGFHDDSIGIDYEAKAEFGMSGEVIPDILRLGFEANLGIDSHNAVDDNDTTLVFPAAQVGPMILLTEPHKRIKLLAAVLFGRTEWDPPWESQVMVSSSF